MARIFVYGTLKQGECRAFALAEQQFLGMVKTEPRYRMFNLGSYPGLVELPTGAQPPGLEIQGELWEVTAECLDYLDLVEGVDAGEYQRRRIFLRPPFHETEVQAYFYLHHTAGFPDCGECW